MITYPKMKKAAEVFKENHKVAVYDKLDGSNIRWQYNIKRGWWKTGTRFQIIDNTDSQWDMCLVCSKKFPKNWNLFQLKNP